MSAFAGLPLLFPEKAKARPSIAAGNSAVAEGRAERQRLRGPRALQEQAKLDDLASLLDEMLAETGGPLTRAEPKAADKAVGR